MSCRCEALATPNPKDLAFMRYIYETNFPDSEKLPFE